jgi:hypothetical protein
MKIFKKEVSRQKLLYGGLIATFAILYGATAFVSWYHAVTFFNIANAIWLSYILSFVAEVGQASALFSLLLTENKKEWLTWFVMVILTMLQVIGNVESSYDWIIKHGDGVESFRKSILFWVQTENTDTFKVIIAWITGAVLPVIALSMTALVAQNLDLNVHKAKTKLDDDSKPEVQPDEKLEWRVVDGKMNPDHIKFVEDQTKINESKISDPNVKPNEPVIDAKDLISEISRMRPTKEDLDELEKLLNAKKPIEKVPPEEEIKEDDFKAEQEKIEKERNYSNEVPPVDQLTKDEAELEVIPHFSDEEVYKMNEDERENSYQEDSDALDEDVENLIPEGPTGDNGIEAGIGTSGTPINEEVVITHNNGLVEAIVETPPENKDEEEKKRIEEERLERIRAIARDNLKKK